MLNKENEKLELLSHIQDLEKQIKNLKDRKKFGLVWEDKPEDVVLACETQVPILKEVKSRKLVSDNKSPTNVLIEGDNYHSLSVLNYTHKGMVDVIYIDPPYNTGATDWRYNNDYVDSNDQWRHSKWISLMRNRLVLAKNLLSERGVIYCAIDHYELFALGLLCDEIFGESNRLGVVTVIHKPEGRQFANFFSPSNEFMLVYAKNKAYAALNQVILDNEQKDRFSQSDDQGLYYLKNFIRLTDGKYSLRENSPEGFYPIYVSKDLTVFDVDKKPGYLEVFPITDRGVERTWKTFGDTFMKKVTSGNIVAKEENGKINIYEKLREDQVIKTHWNRKEYHAYHYGTKIIEEILGVKKFDFPKSLNLLTDILKLSTRKNSVVVDFFAGSGTTGHAVLELNKQDDGNRKFILCTNNENNIAEDVTYERLKRVIKGYKNKKGEKVESLGGNLSYYKTDLVDIERLQRISDESKIKITYQAGEMIAIRENTLNESEKNDWWQIFENEDKKTAIYFKEDKAKLPELVNLLEKENKPTVLYIFGWGKNEYKNEYSSKNIKVEDIPEPIIEVYKEINRI
jgi:adenine-specific DNA-methyltransferase